jgi:hypothetical protein
VAQPRGHIETCLSKHVAICKRKVKVCIWPRGHMAACNYSMWPCGHAY